MRQQLWDKTSIVFAVGIFLTFVAFDVIWCMDTTFASFSFFETYATKIIATLALASVYALTRCRWAQIVVMALLDVLLVANLMYFRTYYSAIPASSYLEAGNLADFKASVTDSLRWADIVLPLITIATAVMAFRSKTTKRQPLTAVLKWWAAPLAGFAMLLTGVNLCKGGFHKSLRSVRQSAYLCSADAPIFSVFGCIWYDITDAAEPITPEKQAEIERGEVWKPGESVYMQFVTYSGHAPFKLPDHLRTITFPASIPEKAADYMTTAHYTDKAIGDFVAYLKTLPQYKETIVVIVGDHEGLASYRQELVGNPACRGLVSDKQLTPFIVLNSPVGMRYDKFMGQIDIYPTLLNLMQLDAYRWHGLGQSILDPRKQGVAVGSVMNVEGTGSDKEVERLKEAHTVSDYMLRYDWLKRLD